MLWGVSTKRHMIGGTHIFKIQFWKDVIDEIVIQGKNLKECC